MTQTYPDTCYNRESSAPKKVSVLANLCSAIDRWDAQDRLRRPHLYIGRPDGLGSKFLFVENVANFLGCSVDFVRRIPRAELPASKIGARVIYQRVDVEAFIQSRRDTGQVKSPIKSSRSKKVSKIAQGPLSHGDDAFDPIGHIRTLKAKR